LRSAVDDPYQPIERKLEITPRCFQVLARFRKSRRNHHQESPGHTRDSDLLGEACGRFPPACRERGQLQSLRRRITSACCSPKRRRPTLVWKQSLNCVKPLPRSEYGAPVMPGLTDPCDAGILAASSAQAGAQFAGYRSCDCLAVASPFERWLDEHFPSRKAKVLSRIRRDSWRR